MSRKQEIYQSILAWSLPFVRNGLSCVVTVPWWKMLPPRKRRRLARSYYEVAQLVHGLPAVLWDEEFTDEDFWFLNVHARAFLERNDAQSHTLYPLLARHIRELFAAVPDHLKHRLEWSGPTEDWSGTEVSAREQ